MRGCKKSENESKTRMIGKKGSRMGGAQYWVTF